MNNVIELKIEKNIPLTSLRRAGVIDIIKEMQVGDSIMVKTLQNASTLYATGYKIGFKMTKRVQEDGTYRVWRVS